MSSAQLVEFNRILSFCFNAVGQYVSSDFFRYFFLPVFCLGTVIILLRVVKYIVQFDR